MYARRWIIFTVLAVGLFIAALNNDVYNATSPPSWSWHVLLRKLYSVVAFALVGGSLIWASGASLRTSTVAIAAYSALIEVAQHITNSGREPFYWNVIDTLCGAFGGALGAFIPGVRERSGAETSAARIRRRHRRV